MSRLMHLALVALVAGCYTGAAATRDVNASWVGRSQLELQMHWGPPAQVASEEGQTLVRYSFQRSRITLPTGHAFLSIRDGHFEGEAALQPGVIDRIRHDVLASVDGSGRIVGMAGPSLRWGPPDDVNLRWGFLFGAHAGMSTLDDTTTPLPGGGLYIGGMLSSTLALVGSFTMAAGTDDAGGALAFAWALAPQVWLATRLWVRAGPAMILAFDPGFEDVGLEPGVSGGASYAIVRTGHFVLDLRLDVAVGTDTTFGTAGIGVNLN